MLGKNALPFYGHLESTKSISDNVLYMKDLSVVHGKYDNIMKEVLQIPAGTRYLSLEFKANRCSTP